MIWICEFLKNSSTLRNKALFTFWLISREKLTGSSRKFHMDVSLDNEIGTKFWKLSGSEVQIQTPYSLWRGLRSRRKRLCSYCRGHYKYFVTVTVIRNGRPLINVWLLVGLKCIVIPGWWVIAARISGWCYTQGEHYSGILLLDICHIFWREWRSKVGKTAVAVCEVWVVGPWRSDDHRAVRQGGHYWGDVTAFSSTLCRRNLSRRR